MIDGLTLFPFAPHWAQQVKVGVEFDSAIGLESLAGLAQRTSGRDFGQRSLSFTSRPAFAQRRAWDAFRDQHPPGTLLGVPLWSEDGIELTADANAGATVLHVSETRDVDWRTELALVALIDPAAVPVIEGAAIESIDHDALTITLAAGLEANFKEGSKVLPLLRARHEADYNESIETEEHSEIDLDFLEDLAAMAAPSLTTTPLTHLGVPVFPLVLEESNPSRLIFTQAVAASARGRTRASYFTARTFPRQQFAHAVPVRDRPTRAAFWKFFCDRRGRWQRFWLASLKNELRVAADIAADATTIMLENFVDFSTRFAMGQPRRALWIEANGKIWLRRATNLAGGTDRISIDTALGVALAKDDVKIALLVLVRFDSDKLEIPLDSPLTGNADVGFIELEREYGEVLATAGTTNAQRSDMEIVTA